MLLPVPAQPHAWAAVVLVDKLDAGRFMIGAQSDRDQIPSSNSLLTGNLTGNFKFLAARATIMASESRVMRTLVWP